MRGGDPEAGCGEGLWGRAVGKGCGEGGVRGMEQWVLERKGVVVFRNQPGSPPFF